MTAKEEANLVKEHKKFVRGLARRYLNKGFELEDLEQQGTIGLLKAIRRFDSNRGALTNLAYPYVLAEIRKLFRAHKGGAPLQPNPCSHKSSQHISVDGGFQVDTAADDRGSIFPAPLVTYENPETSYSRAECEHKGRVAIRAAIKTLAPQQRREVNLRLVKKLPTKAIEERMGLKPARVFAIRAEANKNIEEFAAKALA